MSIERCIDYMQFSAYFQESNCIRGQFTPVSPVRFYRRGYRDKYGIRYYFGAPRGNKCLVVASGETMENLRSLRNDCEIINWGLEAGAKFSRIDLAITNWQTMDGVIFVEDVEKWYVDGLVDSSLAGIAGKKISTVTLGGGSQVETLYIGRMSERGRKGIFRAYDKGMELGIGAYLGTRLELELKRDKAHKTALRLSQTNDIAGNFRAYFNVNHKDFDRLMEAPAVSTKRGKAQEKRDDMEDLDKRWEWLLSQVAPSLKAAIKADRNLGFGDTRLNKFLKLSGLSNEMSEEVLARENWIKEKLLEKISSLQLD